MAKKQSPIKSAPPKVVVTRGGKRDKPLESYLVTDRKQVGGIDKLATGKDKPTITDIKKRQDAADTLSKQWARVNREVAHYFLPRDSDWNITTDAKGRNRAEGLLDSSGAEGINRLVDNGMARLMPLEADWFSLVMSPALAEFLGDTDRRLRMEGELKRYSGVARKFLDRGEFRKSMRTALRNFLIFGWAAVLPRIGMDGEGLLFEVFANNTVALEFSPSVNGGVFWKVKCTVRSWNRQHPYATIEGADDAEKTIVHACLPIGLDWISAVYEEGGNQILFGQWHSECPAVVGKMDAAAGETYPTGLGADNLTEVQILNETRYRSLQLLAMKATPMFIGNSRANLDNFQFRPGGMALIDMDVAQSVGNVIAPLPVGGDANFTMAAQEEMRGNVRNNMAIMPKAPLDSKGFRTAFEWRLATLKEQESIGEKVDAFRTEVILPCIRRAIELIHTMDNSPLPVGLNVDGEFYDVKVVGTQERARALDEVQNLMTLLELSANMPPEIAGAKIDYDAIMRKIMEGLDVGDVVLSEEQSDAYRAALVRAQQAQAEQQQQAA